MSCIIIYLPAAMQNIMDQWMFSFSVIYDIYLLQIRRVAYIIIFYTSSTTQILTCFTFTPLACIGAGVHYYNNIYIYIYIFIATGRRMCEPPPRTIALPSGVEFFPAINDVSIVLYYSTYTYAYTLHNRWSGEKNERRSDI